MTEVTVDLADLEKIVFATAAIKNIEGSLQTRRTDPFVVPHLNFTEAHDRLAAAMRNATRGQADTVVPWDEPLSPEERKFLRAVVVNEDSGNPTQIGPDFRLEHTEVDRLLAKGAIIIGTLCKGVLWSGKTEIMWAPDPSGFAVASTGRGRNKLSAN